MSLERYIDRTSRPHPSRSSSVGTNITTSSAETPRISNVNGRLVPSSFRRTTAHARPPSQVAFTNTLRNNNHTSSLASSTTASDLRPYLQQAASKKKQKESLDDSLTDSTNSMTEEDSNHDDENEEDTPPEAALRLQYGENNNRTSSSNRNDSIKTSDNAPFQKEPTIAVIPTATPINDDIMTSIPLGNMTSIPEEEDENEEEQQVVSTTQTSCCNYRKGVVIANIVWIIIKVVTIALIATGIYGDFLYGDAQELPIDEDPFPTGNSTSVVDHVGGRPFPPKDDTFDQGAGQMIFAHPKNDAITSQASDNFVIPPANDGGLDKYETAELLLAAVSILWCLVAIVGATCYRNTILVGMNVAWMFIAFVISWIVLPRIQCSDENVVCQDDPLVRVAITLGVGLLTILFIIPHIGFIMQVKRGQKGETTATNDGNRREQGDVV